MSEVIQEQEREQDSQMEADRAALAAQAGIEPGQGEPVREGEPEQGGIRFDAVESLSGLLSLVGVAAGIAGAKRTAAIWAPEACGRLAAVTVPVLRKYPWGGRVLDFLETGSGAEELALAMVAAPMGMATWAAINADFKPAVAVEAVEVEKPEGAESVAGNG